METRKLEEAREAMERDPKWQITLLTTCIRCNECQHVMEKGTLRRVRLLPLQPDGPWGLREACFRCRSCSIEILLRRDLEKGCFQFIGAQELRPLPRSAGTFVRLQSQVDELRIS